ncbi:MAG: hypothetical protein COY99_01130, partial [Candidatus Yonathbacteria bacterium CG_4_10_14_0_8_um_filter_47_645]
MSNELNFEEKTYISAKRASELTGYAADYIGQLAREEKIRGHLIGRSWFVEQESLFVHAKIPFPAVPRSFVPAPRPQMLPMLSKFAVALGSFLVIVSIGGALTLARPELSELARATSRSFTTTTGNTLDSIFSFPEKGGALVARGYVLSAEGTLTSINRFASEIRATAYATKNGIANIPALFSSLTSPVFNSAHTLRSLSKVSGTTTVRVVKNTVDTLTGVTDMTLSSYITFNNTTGALIARGMAGVGDAFIGSFVDTYTTLRDTGRLAGDTLTRTYARAGDGLVSSLRGGGSQTASVVGTATNAVSSVFKTVWSGIAGLFGRGSGITQTTPIVVDELTSDPNPDASNTPAPAAKTPAPPPAQTIIVNKPLEKVTVEKTIERVISGVTPADLDARMQQLSNTLLAEIYKVSDEVTSKTQGNFRAIALTQKIDQLTNTAINSPTITGGTISSANISGGSISGVSLSGSSIALSGALSATSGAFSGNLTVSGTATNTFAGDSAFDTDTLTIDSVNNRVGIATTTPSDTFSLNGSAYLAQISAPSNTQNRLYNTGGNLYWAGNLVGGGSVGNWTLSGSDVYRDTGNVGIGTTTPYAKLSVAGRAVIDNDVYASYFTATSTAATSTLPYLAATQANLGTIINTTWQGNAIGDAYLTKTGDWTGTLDGQEGSYYLNASNMTNFGAPFYTYLNATTTDALAQGVTNKYYASSLFDTDFSGKTTDDLTEGATNLYTQWIDAGGYLYPHQGDYASAPYFTATSTAQKSLFTGGVNTSGTTGGYSIDNNL